jgi:hypothetical protein
MQLRRLTLFAMLFVVVIPGASHGQLGRILAQSAERRGARSASRSFLSTLRRDLLRDRATPARSLVKDRSVFRYTTKERARLETSAGLSEGTHFTSHSASGRPLSAASAQRRLGLPTRPTVREKVVLRKGTRVRLNKALGGKRGYGEISLAQHAPPTDVRRVVRLRRTKPKLSKGRRSR